MGINPFNALKNEAQFTKEVLGAGATSIRKANYSEKGIYFQAFTSLSTGFERMAKICVIIDKYIANNGNFQKTSSIRGKFGHNLTKLNKEIKNINEKRSMQIFFEYENCEKYWAKIIKILSDFGKGDRYSNIDSLLKKDLQKDPIERWVTEVDNLFYIEKVSKRKKDEIKREADFIGPEIENMTLVDHTSEKGEKIDTVKDGLELSMIQKATSVYRQFFVVKLIRFYMEILWNLQNEAQKFGREEIPFFHEIFGGFFVPDSKIKRKKRWDNV